MFWKSKYTDEDTITHPFFLLIKREIRKIDRKENLNKWFYYGFRTLQILITGMITVSASTKNAFFCTDLNISIAWWGAVVTALTAIETLFLFGYKKDTYKQLLLELREIRVELLFLIYTTNPIIKNVKLSKIQLEPLFERYKKAKGLLKIRNKDDEGQESGSNPLDGQKRLPNKL